MLFLLVLFAAIVPLVVVAPLQDDVVLPKLVTTATFTGVALIWGAVVVARERWPAGRWPATLWLPAVAFLVVNVLALVFAIDWRRSLMGEHLRYQGLAATLLYMLLFIIAATAVRTPRDLRWLLLGLFAGGLATAIYALIQKAGLDWIEWSGQALNRPAATLGQANAFGAYLVAVINASAFLILIARERWQRAALGIGMLAMLLALLFTLSRAAYVAASVSIVIWTVAAILWFRYFRIGAHPRPSQWALAGTAGIAVVLLLVTLGSLLFVGLPKGRAALGQATARGGPLSAPRDDSAGTRLSLWRMAIRMTADRPLLGHGQDAFTIRFAEYRDRPDLEGIGTANVAPESAHNLLLDLASGTGVLGFLAFLALVGAVLWHAGRRTLATDDFASRAALLALAAAIVGYLMALFFGFSEAMTTWVLWLLLGATAGLLATPSPGSGREAGEPPESGTLAAGTAAVALALVGVMSLGWAATMTAADLSAAQARSAIGRGDYAEAARLAGRAVTLNPLQDDYLIMEGQARERSAAGAIEPADALGRAIETYETLLSRFEPSAYHTLLLAMATFQLAQVDRTPVEDTFDLLEDAVRLDPYNAPVRQFVGDHYARLGFEDRALEHRLEVYCWTMACD